MTGAARLATRAARRIGAGLVTIASSERAFPIYASADPGHLVSTAPLDDLLSDPRKNAVLVGPGAGVGDATKEHVIKSLLAGKAAVIDADALTSFSDSPNTLFDILIEQAVLTPHEGEFARLFPEEGDKLTRTRNAAALCGGVVLLKGADTVIAAPDGRAVINATGTPYLATGGSGDVLAGMITGLLAQGMAPFAAAAAATWIHGRAASAFGPGLIAEDLTEMIPEILGDLISSGVRKRVGSTTEAIVGKL